MRGAIIRHKARLVAQGFTQRYGVDYFDTFSPTPQLKTFKTLCALASTDNSWRAESCDISTAFLYAKADCEMFVRQPEGYVKPGKENWVYRLDKAMYGTKNAGRAWYQDVKSKLESQGFKRSENDNCLFTLKKGSCVVHILVYVDDMVFFHNNQVMCDKIINFLESKYKFSSRGKLEWFLGIHVTYPDEGGIMLSQTAYIDRLITKFGLDHTDVSRIETPYLCGVNGKLNKRMSPQSERERQIAKKWPYAEAVGALQWLVSATRHDIAYSVSAVSRYLSSYGKEHWNAVLRILKYLKNTRTQALHIKHSNAPLVMTAYADSDWAGEEDGRRSQGGYIVKLNGSTVTARSMLQRIVALSSMEAEYIAACECAKEIVWMRRLVELNQEQTEPTKLMEDNRACICLANNPVQHSRSKHIDVRFHYLRQLCT